MSRLSIIIPCFNSALTIERAFHSAKLVKGDVEVVLVNDGSTDETSEILARISAEFGGVFVDSKLNRGQGAARNLGVEHSSGDFLFFLDSDDELISGDFYLEFLRCTQNSAHLAAKGYMQFFDPQKGYVLNKNDPRYEAVVMSSACGLILSKEDFLRIGGFPESPVFRGRFGGEDVAFMQRLSKKLDGILKLPADIYKVWSRTGSHLDIFLSQTRLANGGFEFVGLSDNYRKEYDDLNFEIEKFVNK